MKGPYEDLVGQPNTIVLLPVTISGFTITAVRLFPSTASNNSLIASYILIHFSTKSVILPILETDSLLIKSCIWS